MPLSEEQKRQAREAGAKNAEAIRNREYANPEVQARDEASRVRVVTSDGVKKPSEILSQFGSLNYLFGADQAQHQADLLAHRERMTPALQRFQTAAAGANKLYQDHLKLKPMAISGWTGEYKNAGYADQIHTDHPNLHPTEFREDQNDQTRAWAEKERALRQQAIDYTELSNALTYEELMRNIDFYADLAEQRYQEYIHSEDYVTRTRAQARERDERMRMATALGADPAYMGLFNWESKDEREEELRAIAAYYRNLADAQKDEQLMTADIQELSGWSEEERRRLAQYAVDLQGNYFSEAGRLRGQTADDLVLDLFDKYGEQRVRELAESYLRYQNQQRTEKMIRNTQNMGLPEVDIEAEFFSEPTQEDAAMAEDLRILSRWSSAEQTLLSQYAANPGESDNQFQLLSSRYGEETVKQVAASYNRMLALKNAPVEQEEAEPNRDFWSMAGHSTASVGARFAGSISGFGGYLNELMTRTGRYSTLDPNNAGMLPNMYADTVRQTVGEEIESRAGRGWASVYQAGMGAVDNLARIVLTAGTGSLALAATGGFASGVQEYSQNGIDPIKAVSVGVLRGALEVLTEKVSLDNLLNAAMKPKDFEAFLRSCFRGGGVEVTEEELNLVLTTFLEATFLREESGFNRRVAELQTYGLTREQAREQACYGLLEESLDTAVQSFLSGGMMTGITNTWANVTGGTQPKTASRGTPVVYPDNVEVKQDLLDSAERISGATGRNIVFYSSENTADDGFYDPDTGAIHINVKGVDPMAQIFGHELTHSIESSAMYQQLSNLVMNRIRQTGGNLEQLRAAKMDLYKQNGQTLPDQTAVDREIVASYVASHLLTNEREITSLVQEQPSVGRRILNWLNDLLAKWGNKNAQEREFIRRARDYYARALDQTQGRGNVSNSGTILTGQQSTRTVTNPGTAATASPTGQAVPNWGTSAAPAAQTQQEQQPSPQEESPEDTDRRMQEQYRTGAITEEEYDAYLDERDQYDQQRGVDPMDREDQRFYGEQGRQYSIQERPDGKKYVRADRQVIFGNDPESWSEQVEDYINGKIRRGQDITLTGEDGKPIRITQETAGKMAGMYDGRGRTMNEGLFAVKANAAVHIDEIVQVSVEQANSWKADQGSRHGEFASGGWRYRTAFFQDFDGKYYKLDLSVATGNNGDVAYNIGGINERSFTPVAGSSAKGGALNKGEASSGKSVPREGAKVNRKYSIPENGTPNSTQDAEQDNTFSDYSLDRLALSSSEFNRLQQAENTLLKNAVKSLGIPYHADQSGILAEIHDLSEWILGGGSATNQILQDVYRAFVNRSISINRQFCAQYKETGEEIKAMILDPSDEEQTLLDKDPKVVSRAKRIMRMSEDEGDSVAALYQRAQDLAPELFPDGITNPAAQLQCIVSVYNDVQQGLASLNAAEGKNSDAYEKTMRQDIQGAIQKFLSALQEIQESAYGRIDRQRARARDRAESDQKNAVTQENGQDQETAPAQEESPSPAQSDRTTPKSTGAGKEVNPVRAIVRDNLNAKAANKLRHEETVLLNKVGQALYVPYHAKKDTLKPMIQEMTDEYLRTGQISEETKTRIFEAAYEAGIGIDQEFVEQYKDITPPLRTTAISLSQEERADVPNYAKIRKDANTNQLLRITEDGGRSLSDFYQEMQKKAPDLFPAELTHPADQLQKLFEVSRDIAISENFLIDSRGPQSDSFKAGARKLFDEKIADAIPELNRVRRYGEDRLLSKDETDPITLEEAEDISHKLKNARRNYEKVNAKHLLTAHDEMQVGRLLRGETQLEYLQNEENFESIKAVFEAKQEYEHYAQLLAQYKRQVRKAKLDLADKYLATANTWKDKKAGILYSRETMRRNIFDIIPDDPKLAEAIVEEYFEPIHKSEAANTRFKQEYRDRVKDLGLSRKVNKGDLVSEAHAVQLLGEAADNIRVIENSRGRVKTRDGKTLLEWQAVVQNLWAENPSLDKARIENSVLEFRKIYDELFQKMNQARLANGYEPVSYRQGYFPHFQPGDGDGIMHYFGKILGIDVSVDNLPTTINGLTHTFKPGIQWMGNAQERLGFNTAYDAVEGFDKYIEGVSSVIHHTENIQKLRALATQARYRTSDEGIREQVDAIQRDTRLTDEERQLKIQDIYEHGRFALSNFVVELDEYTNLLANKKSKYDRSMEHLLGRKWYTIMKRAESRVGANMIAGNISSAFTNFIPLTQAMGHFGLIDMAKGARGTLQAIFHKDKSIVGQSDFLTNRRGGDVLVKAWADKLSDVLGTPMELIDSIVSETIVRAAYSQNLRRGLSESEAMHQADIAAAGIMADRSKGALPTLFESSNPLIKLFTQFQVEVNNQYSEIFKDMPREYRDRAKIVLAFAFFKYFLAAFLWNELEEKLKGRRSALDPVDMAGNFYSDWKEAGVAEAIGNLSVNLIEGLPFTSALAFLGVDIDGGRIPVASAIPDVPAVFNALLGRDIPKNVRMRTLGQELQKPITYLLMPAGGGQVAKAWKGIQAYREGGSYSLNQDGEEILQYPIYKDTPQEGAVNLVKSILFGKSSLSTAQEWVANDFDSLSAEETAIYQDLMECGSNPREAYEALRRVQAVPEEDPELVENAADVRRQNQTNIILNDDLSPEAQSILFYGLVATENEQKLMDQMVEVGSGYEGLVKFVSSFYDIKLWEEDDKKGAYRDLLASSGLTEEEKIVAVGDILGTEETTETGNLSIYGKFKLAVKDGMSVDNFMKIYAAGASMDTYFDFSDTGIQLDDAVNLVLEMSELKPLPGAKSVSWYQECDVILGSRLTAAEQVRALQVVCNESTGAKIRIGYDNGLPPGALIWLKQLLPEFDANHNGSYAQREVTAAIDAVSGDDNLIYTMTGTSPHGFRLTNEQKAVLWQLQTGAKDGKSNPYDREIGKLIYDLVQADKEARG